MEKKPFDEDKLGKILESDEIDEKLLDEIPDDLLFNDDLDDPLIDELGGILGNVEASSKPKSKPVSKGKKSTKSSKKSGKASKVMGKSREKGIVVKEITAESMNEKMEIIEQDVGDLKHAMTILLSAVSTISKAVDRIEKKLK